MQRHLVTSIFIFNPENQKFLMIKHKKVGKWLQPGGHLEKGEKPHEAALREVFEVWNWPELRFEAHKFDYAF